MVVDGQELEEVDASELHALRLNAKEVLAPLRSQLQMERFKILGVNSICEHLPNSRRLNLGSIKFQTTRLGMMRKLKMASGRSKEASFFVVTLYLESNCSCR